MEMVGESGAASTDYTLMFVVQGSALIVVVAAGMLEGATQLLLHTIRKHSFEVSAFV